MSNSRDLRAGWGVPLADIDLPVFARPATCLCSWVVIRRGPGRKCVSRLKYKSAACPHRHEAAGSERSTR